MDTLYVKKIMTRTLH